MSKIKDFELKDLNVNILNNSPGTISSITCSIYYINNEIIYFKNIAGKSEYYFTDIFNSHKEQILSEIKYYFLKYPKYFTDDITDEVLIKEFVNDLLRLNEIQDTYKKNNSNGYKFLVCVNFSKRTLDYTPDEQNFMLSLKSVNDKVLTKIKNDYDALEVLVYDSLESINIK